MVFAIMQTCFLGIVKVLFIGISGAIVLGYITGSLEKVHKVLSSFFVKVAMPCLVFHNMATKFDPGLVPDWWVYPLLGIGSFVAGAFAGYIYCRFDSGIRDQGVFTASVTFNNSMLLPLAVAPMIFQGERLTSFLNLLFLYNIMTVPAFFSVGIWMVRSSSRSSFKARDAVNPPVVATILGIIVALSGTQHFIPDAVYTAMHLVGKLSAPLSMLIVGGAIAASFHQIGRGDLKEPAKITLIKSLVMPLVGGLFVLLTHPPSDIALFITLGSAMPVGSIVAVIIPSDEAIRKTVAGGIVLSNFASVIAVPAVMSLYGALYGGW